MVTKKHTHLEIKSVFKDKYGPPTYGKLSSGSVVLMLLYLTGHTRPDISCAINCCAQ